ncbi:MAG: hypothetical protein E7434_00950 [Ruminococcaceae bacterium]|nr:hypothetical protein [Oscillospiraceae bacterium]
MKKLFALLLCLVMIFSMVGCASDETEATEAPETEATTEAPATAKGDEMSLTEILDGIYDGYTGELPDLVTTEITDAETFEFKTFTSYVDGYEAAISEPPMTSVAHCVVLVRVPEGADAEAVRADMEQNADPQSKWLCVMPEKIVAVAHNNTIMLVMSTADRTDAVVANFDALWA